MNVVDVAVYAVAVLVVGSLLLYTWTAVFRHRPQKVGLFLAIVAIPLYMIYYNDRWQRFVEIDMRDLVRPLENIKGADPDFLSNVAPAAIIGILTLVRVAIYLRVSVRNRLQGLHDAIANFFAGATFVTLVVATIVSTFHLGWIGAVVLGLVSAAIYLGVLALLAAIFEVIVEISKLISVWLQRKVFALATRITRIASWISSLGGRIVPRSLVEKIQQDTANQESIFQREQEAQDTRLVEAHERDVQWRSARRRRDVPAQAEAPAMTPLPQDGGPLATDGDLPHTATAASGE